MNTRPPVATATATGSEAPRRPADFLQPLARRVDQRPMTGQPSAAAEKDARRLTVARGISMQGSIAGCQRLVVEGAVEASLENCDTLEVAEQGRFVGTAEVEQAEVRGTVEGDLTVRGRLVIRAAGRVKGRIRYQDLHIEAGGKLHGQIETLEPDLEAEDRAPEDAPEYAPGSSENRGEVARFSFAPAVEAAPPAGTVSPGDNGGSNASNNGGTVAHELGVIPGSAPQALTTQASTGPATPTPVPQVSGTLPLDLTESADPAPRLPTLRPS